MASDADQERGAGTEDDLAPPSPRSWMAAADPGWYPDGRGRMRWWDGTRWTNSYLAGTSRFSRKALPIAALTSAALALVAFVIGLAVPMTQSTDHYDKCLVPDPAFDWLRWLGAAFFAIAAFLIPAAVVDYRGSRSRDGQRPDASFYVVVGAAVVMVAATVAGLLVIAMTLSSSFCDLGG